MKASAVGPKAFGLAVFAVLAIGIFVMLFRATGGQVRFSQPYKATAIVPSAVQLAANGDVRRAGVKVGRITKIGHRGARGLVEFELKDAYAPLPQGTTVRVRTKTLVGENYLEITPGKGPGTLDDGTTLPFEQAEEAVQIDEVLSTLDAPTRAAVKRDLDALGRGFAGRGDDLNRLTASVEPLGVDGARVANVLAVQRRRVADVVDQLDDLLGAIGDRGEQLRTLSREALRTVHAVSARDDALASAFQQLPSTLTQVRSSSAALRRLSDAGIPVVVQLDRAAPKLTRALRDLGPAARDTRALTDRLPQLTRRLSPAVDALKRFAPVAGAAMPALQAVLREANPMLSYLAPYSREAGSFFGNVGAFNEPQDAGGSTGRVHVVIDESTLTTFTPELRRAMEALVYSGVIGKLHKIQKNSYPAPGTMNDLKPFTGTYPRVTTGP